MKNIYLAELLALTLSLNIPLLIDARPLNSTENLIFYSDEWLQRTDISQRYDFYRASSPSPPSSPSSSRWQRWTIRATPRTSKACEAFPLDVMDIDTRIDNPTYWPIHILLEIEVGIKGIIVLFLSRNLSFSADRTKENECYLSLFFLVNHKK